MQPFSSAMKTALNSIVRNCAVRTEFKGEVIVHHYKDKREYLQVEVELRHSNGDIEFKRYFLDAETIKIKYGSVSSKTN